MQELAAPGSTQITSQKWIRFGFWSTAVALVALAGIRHLADPTTANSCTNLLNEGEWKDSRRTQWQPKGCMLKPYDTPSTNDCIGGQRIVMIGDSLVRQLFYATVKRVLPDAEMDADSHSFLIFKDPLLSTTFEFYWDPFLNKTRPLKEHATFSESEDPLDRKPSIFLIGSGLWYLQHSDETGGMEAWKKMIQSRIDELSDPSDALALADHLIMAPISAVNKAKLSYEGVKALQPTDIEAMNIFLNEATRNSAFTVPFSWSQMTAASDVTENGLHHDERIINAEVEVMFNYLCNNKLPKVPPMSVTCCYDYPANRWFQTIMITLFWLCLPIAYYMERLHVRGLTARFLPSSNVLRAALIMAGAMLYMYYADRTPMFAKNNKMFSSSTFAVLLFLCFLAGSMTFQKTDKSATFLNRSQTDEWKGWMQLIILVYHYVGASSVSAIYNPIRVLVASYLFMTGFGHFVYYYKKDDFGLRRVASILLRLNLLTALIVYTMNTSYLTYYFAPLVSFFYLVIYAMMYIGHSYNHNSVFLLSKLLITSIATAALILEPWPIESAFGALHSVFGITWSASEWRFRLQLDVWIVFVGALVGYLSIKAQTLSITDHPQWKFARQSAIALSGFGIVGYFWFASSLNKLDYNVYHPFISYIPILSFVVLRNSTSSLRSTSSTFFAFIGKCSLETFIAQYHIWLAGDTKGILIISPWLQGSGSWTVNLILSTILFILISNAISGATGVLADWLVTANQPREQILSIPMTISQPEAEQGLLADPIHEANPDTTQSQRD